MRRLMAGEEAAASGGGGATGAAGGVASAGRPPRHLPRHTRTHTHTYTHIHTRSANAYTRRPFAQAANTRDAEMNTSEKENGSEYAQRGRGGGGHYRQRAEHPRPPYPHPTPSLLTSITCSKASQPWRSHWPPLQHDTYRYLLQTHVGTHTQIERLHIPSSPSLSLLPPLPLSFTHTRMKPSTTPNNPLAALFRPKNTRAPHNDEKMVSNVTAVGGRDHPLGMRGRGGGGARGS